MPTWLTAINLWENQILLECYTLEKFIKKNKRLISYRVLKDEEENC
ncbi:MAG: hypothetical protein WED07_01900 [Candidatus Freyarchaeum deiterrae]